MKEISLIPGEHDELHGGAFDRAKMKAEGVNNISLTRTLMAALDPFSGLLREGCGFALVRKGGRASIVGVLAEAEEPEAAQ